MRSLARSTDSRGHFSLACNLAESVARQAERPARHGLHRSEALRLDPLVCRLPAATPAPTSRVGGSIGLLSDLLP